VNPNSFKLQNGLAYLTRTRLRELNWAWRRIRRRSEEWRRPSWTHCRERHWSETSKHTHFIRVRIRVIGMECANIRIREGHASTLRHCTQKLDTDTYEPHTL